MMNNTNSFPNPVSSDTCRMVWYGMGMVYGVWYGVWYGMVWCSVAWRGVVWYGMVTLFSHGGLIRIKYIYIYSDI